jgi:hypothetical protein
VDLTTIEVIITLAKTAAERLNVVAESKLDTKSLAEAREAQHALANLRRPRFKRMRLKRTSALSPIISSPILSPRVFLAIRFSCLRKAVYPTTELHGDILETLACVKGERAI